MRKSILTLTAVFILLGCGGGGSHSNTSTQNPPASNPPTQNPPQEKHLSGGKVSDGYIAGADVLVDINASKGFPADSQDYLTKTDTQGNFSIPNNVQVPKGTFIYARGGVVIATGEDFNGTLKGVFDGSKKEIALTPVTTMVASLVENGHDVKKAKEKVAKALNIPPSKVDADPVKDKDALKAVQKVVTIAKVMSAKTDKNVTDVVETIAQKLAADDNLTKAVQESAKEVTNDDNEAQAIAQAALTTAQKVKEVIEHYTQEENTSNTAIEAVVQEHIVKRAEEVIQKENNVSEVANAVEEAVQTVTNNDFKDVTKVASCLSFEKIKGQNQNENEVTTNLNVNGAQTCIENNVSIAWINAGENVDINGSIIRPNYDDTLTYIEANISKNDKFLLKPIYFTIKAKGKRPIAKPDNVQVNEDSNITIDVLNNDEDDNKSELNVSIAVNPQHGNAVVDGNKIKYSPNPNFTGEDLFVYKLKDPYGAESNATVTIEVLPVNDAPHLVLPQDEFNLLEDFNATAIELNATDADINDTLTFNVSGGDGLINAHVQGNVLHLAPVANANGDTNLTITVTDSHGASDSKTVTLHILPVNDAPVLDDIALPEINEDSNTTLINLSATDVDANDSLTFSAHSLNEAIAKVNVINNKLQIIPMPNAFGDVNITISVTDSQGASDSKTFTLHINPVNDAPHLVLPQDEFNLLEDFNATAIELNATDADINDTLTFNVSGGDGLINAHVQGNVLHLAPVANANGDTNLTITVTDSHGASDSKTVTLHILPVNDAPIARDDNFSVQLPQSEQVSPLLDVLKNDSDIDNDKLSIINVDNPYAQIAPMHEAIIFNPPRNFEGDSISYTFHYTISDGNTTTIATVHVTVHRQITTLMQAINKAKGFDKNNESVDTLLSDLNAILSQADINETDAQIALALVHLAQTLNDDLGNLLFVGQEDASFDKLLHKDGAKILLKAIDNFGDASEETLTNLSNNLITVAKKIDVLLTQNPNYQFSYKGVHFNANDLKALSALCKAKAATIDYIRAYNIIDGNFIATKTKTINGQDIEYQEIKINPVAALNDNSTLSLKDDAQSKFDSSKAKLQAAINQIATLNIAQTSFDAKIKDKLQNFKTKLLDINNSLNGIGTYMVHSEKRDVYLKVNALFNANSALTLANTFGHNFAYEPQEAEFNRTLSIYHHKPIGIISDGNNTYMTKLKVKISSLPEINGFANVISKVVIHDENGSKEVNGSDLRKAIFGGFSLEGPHNLMHFNSVDDVNITFVIQADLINTAPYSCNIQNAWLEPFAGQNQQQLPIDAFNIQVNNNQCIVTINSNFIPFQAGHIGFVIEARDNFGHSDRDGVYFGYGNPDNGGEGGNEGGNQNEEDLNNTHLTQEEYNNFMPSSLLPNGEYYEINMDINCAHIEHIQINDNNITLEGEFNATLIKEINNETKEIIAKDQNGNIIGKIKYVKELNASQLNQLLNTTIFNNNDKGYLVYQEDDDENPIQYEKSIWFNSFAKDKIVAHNTICQDQGNDNTNESEDNNNEQNITINFSQQIDEQKYNNTNAIIPPMQDFPLYSIKYQSNQLPHTKMSKYSLIDENTINRKIYEDGNLTEENNVTISINNNEIAGAENNQSVPFVYIKFMSELNADALNEEIGQEIFQNSDNGYVVYIKYINKKDNSINYKSYIWLNESAKNSFENFIQNFQNNQQP